jgi:2-keto-4-pentenoate hydratase/2-oxohepta-3-ene-1,7-dioic acid hydratase in catechol pathway
LLAPVPPICYKCNVETIIGPGDPLLWPSYTGQLDFELELGFFIAGGGVNLTPKQAAGLIAGVTIFNDVSARDIQVFEMSLTIGPSKGKDFCSAMGPVGAREAAPPGAGLPSYTGAPHVNVRH